MILDFGILLMNELVMSSIKLDVWCHEVMLRLFAQVHISRSVLPLHG